MTKTAKEIVRLAMAINNATTQQEREQLTQQLNKVNQSFNDSIYTDTNTDTDTDTNTNTDSKQTASRQQADTDTDTATTIILETIAKEIKEEETEQTTNFEPITDFKADLKGAERLMWKGVKLINRFGNIYLNEWDKQDAISAIYIAVIQYEPTEDSTPLAEISQQYFGIQTREQFRAGYNALQKVIYGNRQQAKTHDYDQEYGLDGTAAKDEHAEVELDILLQEILSEKLNKYLDYYLQGYKQKEIAEIMGVSINIPKKYLEQCKAIIGKALNYKG